MIRVRWTINKVGGSERRVTIEESAPATGGLVMLQGRLHRVQASYQLPVPVTQPGKPRRLTEWRVHVTTSGVRQR